MASGVPLIAALSFPVDVTGACAPAPGSPGERSGAQDCRVADLPAPEGYLAAVAMLGDAPFAVRQHRWHGSRRRTVAPVAA
jgi:hypothetical protein